MPVLAVTSRPFPWRSLPKVTRATAAADTALRRSLGAGSAPGRALAALGELAGAPVSLRLQTTASSRAATLASTSVTLTLHAPASPPAAPAWWVLLEVDPVLVVGLVSGLLKRPLAGIALPGLPPPSVVGAFAALLAAAVRRAGVPVVVTEASPYFATEATSDQARVASFNAFFGDETTLLRAFFPSRLVQPAPLRATREAFAALGALPLDLPVVACSVEVPPAELATLTVGDAWLLGEAWTLGRLNARLEGPVTLLAGASEVGLMANLEADGRLVLRDGTQELGWSPMVDESDADAAVVEAVGDVPVVVRVEIGAARLTAKEWSALGPGDVVGLGSPIGGLVVLRVSGRAIAEGELVDLEGEVGVRISRRLHGGAS